MTEFFWKDRETKEYVYDFLTRPECLALIQRPPAVALDIGCGSGGVGHALRQSFPQCELWGCELNASAAQFARQHFHHVVEQDVETVDWPALGLTKPFDLVCLFDVLEHLFNPWTLLQGLHRLIAPDAQLLVSLPNAANLPLLYDALHGHWRYRNWGLLDFTHLRFFADLDARKMFYQTGYRVLDHRMTFLGAGGGIYENHRNGIFPTLLNFGDMWLHVQTPEHLQKLCADQNLYLISPHHGQFNDDAERSLASNDYPQTFAFGGG